jgi:hypothetical protein
MGTANGVEAQCVVNPGGVKGADEACSSDDECQPGMLCQPDSCLPMCCPDTDEPCMDDGGTCTLQLSFNGTDKFVMVCAFSQSCTLFQPDTCPDGEDCHPEDTSQGIAKCHPPAPRPADVGEACAFINSCADSVWCNATCIRLCDVTTWQNEPAPEPGLGGCPAGETCNPAGFGGAFANVGTCDMP